MEAHPKCPNCGRKLAENELYCYFCDMEIAKLKRKIKKSSIKQEYCQPQK